MLYYLIKIIVMSKIEPIEIFKFEKRCIVSHLMYEKKMDSKFKQAFLYLINKIKPQKFEDDLSKLEWDYHWVCVQQDSVILLIRKYQFHFTIYFKIIKTEKFNEVEFDESNYGCFIFHTDRDRMSGEESDSLYNNNYLDLNECLGRLMSHLAEHGSHSLWNDSSFPRSKRIEIKNVWDGGRDDLSSIDDFAYCCEELFEKYLEHFAMNEMLEKIKTFKVGDMLDTYKITYASTEVKDEYYHGVGLSLFNTNFPNSKESWADVYSLSRYYYNYVFPNKK